MNHALCRHCCEITLLPYFPILPKWRKLKQRTLVTEHFPGQLCSAQLCCCLHLGVAHSGGLYWPQCLARALDVSLWHQETEDKSVPIGAAQRRHTSHTFPASGYGMYSHLQLSWIFRMKAGK